MTMLRKLRLQFIAIASLAVLVVLGSFIGVFNSFYYIQDNGEIDTILDILEENDGQFPSYSKLESLLSTSSLTVARAVQIDYFSYTVDSEDAITESNLTHIRELTEEDFAELAERINLSDGQEDIIEYDGRNYAYRVIAQSDGTYLVVVLDATSYMANRSSLFTSSLQISLLSLVFFIAILFVLSSRAIKPYMENMENQKRFITNAGHELKTPLAIISANTEMQELLDGETEWSKSTKDQVARMTELINQMVTLAKLEEQPDIALSDCDFSAIAEDAAEDFKAPVVKDGKSFVMDITPNIHVKAESKSLFELVTILVDNANKYCDPAGTVTVRLTQTNLKKARLEISNTYVAGKDVDYSKFFDRFYREDESHNSRTAGFGIGLSMAQSMVRIFKGKISASYKGDTITFRVIL